MAVCKCRSRRWRHARRRSAGRLGAHRGSCCDGPIRRTRRPGDPDGRPGGAGSRRSCRRRVRAVQVSAPRSRDRLPGGGFHRSAGPAACSGGRRHCHERTNAPLEEEALEQGPEVFVEPVVLAVARDHPLASRTTVGLADLAGQVVLRAGRRAAPYWDGSGSSPATWQELATVAAGGGVSPLAAHAADYFARPSWPWCRSNPAHPRSDGCCAGAGGADRRYRGTGCNRHRPWSGTIPSVIWRWTSGGLMRRCRSTRSWQSLPILLAICSRKKPASLHAGVRDAINRHRELGDEHSDQLSGSSPQAQDLAEGGERTDQVDRGSTSSPCRPSISATRSSTQLPTRR